MDQHARVIEHGLRASAEARAFVSDRLTEGGLDDLADDARLAVTELVSNVVLHTSSVATVWVDLTDDSARVHVHDDADLPPVRGLLDMWSDPDLDQGETAGLPPGPCRVEIPAIPAASLVAAKTHIEDLVRDLTLLSAAHADAEMATLPGDRSLVALADRLHRLQDQRRGDVKSWSLPSLLELVQAQPEGGASDLYKASPPGIRTRRVQTCGSEPE